jgi:hypothetical protein
LELDALKNRQQNFPSNILKLLKLHADVRLLDNACEYMPLHERPMQMIDCGVPRAARIEHCGFSGGSITLSQRSVTGHSFLLQRSEVQDSAYNDRLAQEDDIAEALRLEGTDNFRWRSPDSRCRRHCGQAKNSRRSGSEPGRGRPAAIRAGCSG